MPYKSQWPKKLELPEAAYGFEDLAFLFTGGRQTRGIIRMDLEEAAFLYKYCSPGITGDIVEIGRAEGGSTILLGTAAKKRRVISIDNDPVDDEHLQKVLEKLGLTNVLLWVGDSQTMKPMTKGISMLFIDGDHTYKGVKADFENWFPSVFPGGFILLHDVTTSGLENYGPEQLYNELLSDKRVKPVGKAGSMRAMVRMR